MLDAELFIGWSVEIVDKYVGPGGVFDGKLEKCKKYVLSATKANLVV